MKKAASHLSALMMLSEIIALPKCKKISKWREVSAKLIPSERIIKPVLKARVTPVESSMIPPPNIHNQA